MSSVHAVPTGVDDAADDVAAVEDAIVGICTPASEGSTRSRAGVATVDVVAATVVVPASNRPVANA
jgi:hypothetical protein